MSERKSLSYLIEAEMDKATVLMASKGITDNLQKMAEDVAMMVAKDVMPLGDTMREVFGLESAKAFQSAISEKLNSLVTSISEVKDSINEQIDALESGEMPSDLNTDSTDDLFGDDEGEEAEMGDDDFADAAPSGDRDMKDSDEDDFGDLDDVFADSPAGTGRGMKEGAKPLRAPLSTGDARIAREFANLIREGKDVAKAARLIAETYAIDLSAVAKIVTKIQEGKVEKLDEVSDDTAKSYLKKRGEQTGDEMTRGRKKRSLETSLKGMRRAEDQLAKNEKK